MSAITLTCEHCGKGFSEKPSHHWRKYCCRQCSSDAKRVALVDVSCPICGEVKLRRPNEVVRYCKETCSSEAQKRVWAEGRPRKAKGPTTEAGKAASLAGLKKWRDDAEASGLLEDVRVAAKIARGLDDHVGAKHWVILDPSNKKYEMSNLHEWVRQNLMRFHDKNPASKLPFSERISAGLMATLGDNASVRYQGWRAVSKQHLNLEGDRR